MTNSEIAERKVHEMETALDDLTSLAQIPSAAEALRKTDLEGIERRLRHLRIDLMCQTLQAAE